tara:strand:- start:1736 stop:2035 length:300 start_codon:yes stop_codon:yes gene_type:complete
MEGKVLLALLELLNDCGVSKYLNEYESLDIVKKWMDKHLTTSTQTQSVIKTKFSSEEEDALKYYLAGKLTEELMYDVVDVDVEPTRITTKVIAFKRRGK